MFDPTTQSAAGPQFCTFIVTMLWLRVQVAETRCKAAGLSAFQQYCRMSRLMSAAAVLRRCQVRPLVLAHIHAWLQDTLHATFYLCWWRWKRRAVARMRWRAALGLHMYRCAGRAVDQPSGARLWLIGWRCPVAMAGLQVREEGSHNRPCNMRGCCPMAPA